jgi:formylmethanofuran dehydrogenase subunit B
MIEQKISETIRKLPPSLQQELLDFADFLVIKAEQQEAREWSNLSLDSAIRGMESEASLYALEDLKVVFR